MNETKILTPKQKAFCEYLVNDPGTQGNGTASAIKAGYSEKTAYSIASENLRKPEIVAYIERLKAAKTQTNVEKIKQWEKDLDMMIQFGKESRRPFASQLGRFMELKAKYLGALSKDNRQKSDGLSLKLITTAPVDKDKARFNPFIDEIQDN